jgi:hypothetical protein
MMDFCGNYQVVVALNESSTFSENTLKKASEFYKLKHPKKGFILKDVAQLSMTREMGLLPRNDSMALEASMGKWLRVFKQL